MSIFVKFVDCSVTVHKAYGQLGIEGICSLYQCSNDPNTVSFTKKHPYLFTITRVYFTMMLQKYKAPSLK